MGGKSKKVTSGFWYSLGLHFVIAKGCSRLLKIVVGDRTAWTGAVQDNEQIYINAEDLFGGKKREGGVLGYADVMFGADDQTNNDYLDSKVGISLPSFRGFFGLVFRGGKVTANNPYPKPWAFKIERILTDWHNETNSAWYSEKARIHIDTNPPPSEVLLSDLHDTYEYQLTSNSVPADINNPTIPSAGYSSATGGFGHNGDASPPTPYTEWPAQQGIWVRQSFTVATSGTLRVYGLVENAAFAYINGTLVSADNPTNSNSTGSPSFSGSLSVAAGTHTIHVLGLDETTNFGGSDNTRLDLYVAFTADAESLYAMNPAHMLYQCITDTDFGMGYPAASVDSTSFTAAADTLYDEDFGLCLPLVQQLSVQDFMQTVLDHCGGVQYTDPESGKWVLKLLRDDYDPDTLEVYDEDQIISIDSFQRPGYGETVNQIIVRYTDEKTADGKQAATPAHNDLANIAAQGAIVSQARSYPGLPSAELANRVADRDLRAASTPLAKMRVTMTRAGWALRPGDVIKISWAKLGLSGVIMRVIAISTGTLENGALAVDLVEDVFGLPASSFVSQEDSGWSEPDTSAQDIVLEDVYEAPYWDVSRTLGPADLALVDADAGYVEAVAARVNGVQQQFQIYSRVAPVEYEAEDVGEYVPTAQLLDSIAQDDTAITFTAGYDLDEIEVPLRALMGTGRLAEWVYVTAIDTDAGTATVTRAVLDTTPQSHAIGTQIWFVGETTSFDTTEYATADDVDVKLISIAGGGESTLAAATELSLTLDQRFYRPYPPGNVAINDVAYPDTLEPDTMASDPLTVTWAHRDRVQQTAGYIAQTETDIGPEAGTTYNAYAYDDETDTLLDSDIGLTGTSWVPTIDDDYRLRIEIESERDGAASWQRQVRIFNYVVSGRISADGEARITADGSIRDIGE